jgi:uncharacterized repeat protein (TIGR01451 family)
MKEGEAMKWVIPVALSFVFFVSMGTGPVHAQAKGGVELRMVAEQEIEVVNDDGEKEVKRIEAAKVVPGDVVIYTIHYMNRGEEAADSVVITNPIPEHMIYKNGSASGEGTTITFSVDEGKTYDSPENLKVVAAEGKERPAQASDYTHVRWTFKESLLPEATGYVAFRAILQ